MLTHPWLIGSINIKRKKKKNAHRGPSIIWLTGERRLDKVLRSFPWGHLGNGGGGAVCARVSERARERERKERPKGGRVYRQCPHLI